MVIFKRKTYEFHLVPIWRRAFLPMKIWVGKIFNGCEILEPVDPNERAVNKQFKMKCKCGNIFISSPKNIKSGNTRSSRNE